MARSPRSASTGFWKKFFLVVAFLVALAILFAIYKTVNAAARSNPIPHPQPQLQAKPEHGAAPRVIREREVVYKDVPPPQYNKRGPYQNDASDYKQVGLLVSKDLGESPPVMLPLFGRKMVNRDRFEYYTATDKIHLWKVPVEYEHRDCQDQLGCQQIYDGVDVVVPDYGNKTFSARIYKNVNIHDRIDV